MTNILKRALENAPKAEKKAQKAERDNSQRDENLQKFITNCDEEAFKQLPSHAQNKINSILNTILQFLQNSTLIQNGQLTQPSEGYEATNFAIAEAILENFLKIDSKFFNFARHDREVAENTPLKTAISAEMGTAEKFALISEIIANIKEQQ